MKRKINNFLVEWKDLKKRKPLIIRGARQVGKSYSIEQFGIENFDNFVKIDLEYNKKNLEIFNKNNPQLITTEIAALTGKSIIAGKTLLFIDEIHVSPQAIVSLTYFAEEMPDLHVIAASSFLDHTLNEIQYSIPAGRIEFAYMHPLSFYEFLEAIGQKGLIDYIQNYNLQNEFSLAVHNSILEFLRLYFFIGGMPEAVQTYIDTKDLLQVQRVHAGILTSLQFDFAKYGTRKQQEIMQSVFGYVANNLGNKVKYVNIDRNSSSSQIKKSILKLEMSRIILLARKTKSTKPPINQQVDNDVFKSYFFDIGLSSYLIGFKYSDLKNLITDFKGSLAEQFVAQEFVANADFFEDKKLYYWLRENKSSNAEIDFLYQKGNKILPIEVKSGKSGSLKSLHVFMAKKNRDMAVRFNIDLPKINEKLTVKVSLKSSVKKVEYKFISLPLYLADLFDEMKL
ncbi:MAG: ATP-binding protein [Bacteroidales bacterium]|nr:ATP-binding protein [Bacteroidales bacterium]